MCGTESTRPTLEITIVIFDVIVIVIVIVILIVISSVGVDGGFASAFQNLHY